MPRDPAPELPTWSDYRFAVAPRVNGLSEPSPFEVSWWSELQDGAPRSSTDSRWDQQTRVMHAIECLARLAHKPELARDLVKACNLDFRWQARTATLQCDLDGRIVRAREAFRREYRTT